MNRVFSITLLACGLLLLSACGSSTSESDSINSEEPTTETQAPSTDTQAPSTDTQAPSTDTQAPITGGYLSEDQTFVVADDAPNGEVVGVVRAFPEYEKIGTAPTFSGGNSRYAVSADGTISIQDNAGLLNAGANDSFNVTVAKTGYSSITIQVSVTVLDADTSVFIDPSAATDGIGTRASPRNIMPSSFSDNTTYLLRRGTVLTGSATWRIGGLSNVLFASYGTGAKPELRNQDIAFRIDSGSDHITLRDLHLSHSTLSEMNVDVVAIYGSAGQWSNISIVNNEISYWNQAASIISWNGQPLGNNVTVEWNHVHHIGQDGIFVSHADGLTSISNNTIEQVNTRWDWVGHTEAEAGGDGIQTGFCHDVKINHNYIDRSATGNKFCIIPGDMTGYLQVNNNYLITPFEIGSGIYWIRSTGEIKGNTIVDPHANASDNGIWLYGGDNIEITHNIFMGINQTAVLNQGAANVRVWQNVFYDSDIAISHSLTAANIVESRNNIFFLNPGQIAYSGVIASIANSDYNLFNVEQTGMFGPGNDILAAVQPAAESHSVVGNPLFVDAAGGDFHIGAGSPARDIGILLGLTYDRYGNLVDSNPDSGVHEYTAP